MTITTSNWQTPLRDPFLNKIIPYLLDPEDPQTMASMNAVCRNWRAHMLTERPYLLALKNLKYPGLDMYANRPRASYLAYLPKSLSEKMQLAFYKAQIGTSSREANFVAMALTNPLVLDTLIVDILQMNPSISTVFSCPISLLVCGAAITPSNHATEVRFVENLDVIAKRAAIAGCTLIMGIFLTHMGCIGANILGYYTNEEANMNSDRITLPMMNLLACGFFVLPYFISECDTTTELFEGYRTAKSSIAALKPVVQKVTSVVGRCISTTKSLKERICNATRNYFQFKR
jgi:hypothetical protein